jgi:hypothetical protein
MARDREGGSRELLCIEALRANLRGILTYRDHARYGFANEMVSKSWYYISRELLFAKNWREYR